MNDAEKHLNNILKLATQNEYDDVVMAQIHIYCQYFGLHDFEYDLKGTWRHELNDMLDFLGEPHE